MITKSMAVALGLNGGEVHKGICKLHVGKRGGKKYQIRKWRVNGKCKTWKTLPLEFKLPIKFGFSGPYDYITRSNADQFHLVTMCNVLFPHAYGKED